MKNIFSLLFLASLFCWSCQADSDIAASPVDSSSGTAGSYARFMIVDDFMYIIDTEKIKTFDLQNAAEPTLIDEQTIGERIESIFNLGNRLFIGSGEALYLYEIAADGKPIQKSTFSYDVFDFNGCDPVVANETYAYVTLNTTQEIQQCNQVIQSPVNQLNIFNVTDIENPQLLAEYPMDNPRGVGLDGTTLFVCDYMSGLKIYNVEDPTNIQLIAHFDDFTAYDVIPLGGLLLVVGTDNVYQFDYSDLENITKLSEIPIQKV